MTYTDTDGLVDLRHDPEVRAGALAWDSPDLTTGWHRHPYHQLEYALTGIAEVETERGRYLLPGRQAIWIPAGTEHNTTLRGVSSVSLFYHPDDLSPGVEYAAVIAVAPLLREMVRYSTRWPITRPNVVDHDADVFFEAVGIIISDALSEQLPFHLPAANDPVVARVLELTNADLPGADLSSICGTVGVSGRTLRRRIRADISMSWAGYLTQARVLAAMSLLAGGEGSVLDAAAEVGFASPSGFTRAFRSLTGVTPGAYRKGHSARSLTT